MLHYPTLHSEKKDINPFFIYDYSILLTETLTCASVLVKLYIQSESLLFIWHYPCLWWPVLCLGTWPSRPGWNSQTAQGTWCGRCGRSYWHCWRFSCSARASSPLPWSCWFRSKRTWRWWAEWSLSWCWERS